MRDQIGGQKQPGVPWYGRLEPQDALTGVVQAESHLKQKGACGANKRQYRRGFDSQGKQGDLHPRGSPRKSLSAKTYWLP